MGVGRIRSIKPELPSDEALGGCSIAARYLFTCSWSTCCDDYGRFRAAPALLRGAIFAYDDMTTADIDDLLKELAHAGCIELYEVNGQRYGHVVNWEKHQRVSNRGKPDFPDPPPPAASCGELPQVSASDGDPLPFAAGEEKKGEEDTREPDPFLAFWSQYPRKVAKQEAQRAFKATTTSHELIMAGLSAWTAYWRTERTEEKYIPHASTWLKRCGWNDKPPTTKGPLRMPDGSVHYPEGAPVVCV